MKNPFKNMQDQKQALESFVVKQQMYLLNSVLEDLKSCDLSSEVGPVYLIEKREKLLKNLCDKYYISQEDLDNNIYYIDNIENEKD